MENKDDKIKDKMLSKQDKLIDGYKINDFPNRERRRQIAKARGFFREEGEWARSNQYHDNVQTYIKKKEK